MSIATSDSAGTVNARVVALFALAFAGMGIPRLFTNTAAMSLFVDTYGAGMIPYTYAGAALLVPMLGFVYLRLERIVSFRVLLVIGLLFDLTVLISIRLALDTAAGQWMVFAAAIWVEAEWALVSMVFWGLAARSFHVRDAKRLFGLIGAGEPLAIIVGGLTVPVLLTVVTVVDLFWVSAIGIAVAILLVLRLAPMITEGGAHQDETEQHQQADSSQRLWSLRGYLGAVFTLSTVAVIAHFFIDNAFFDQAENKFHDQTSLASFVGVFYSVVGVATLFGNLLASGWLLKRHGVRVGLLVLPVALLAGCAGVLAADAANSLVIVFWLVCATKLIDESVRWSVFWPSFLVLFQPLAPRDRTRAQILNESLIEQFAAGVAGGLLLVLGALFVFHSIEMLAVVAGMCVLWVAITLAAHRGYFEMLAKALPARRLGLTEFTATDEDSREVLHRSLSSRHAAERLYSMRLLLGTDQPVASLLLPLLEDEDSAVRHELAVQIESNALPGFDTALASRLDLETDSGVKSAILRALPAVDGGEMLERLAPYLHDADPELRYGAMTGLLRHGGIEGVVASGEAFLRLVRSGSDADKMLAARVLQGVGKEDLLRPLLSLLAAADPGVRRAAFRAAAVIRSPRLWPAVIDGLDDPAVCASASTALVASGANVVPALVRRLAEPTVEGHTRTWIVRTLGRIGGLDSIAALLTQLARADTAIELDVTRALIDVGYKPDPHGLKVLHGRIHDDVRSAAFILAGLLDVADHETRILAEALGREFDQTRERIFLLLVLLGGSNLPDIGWREVVRRGEAYIAYVLEMMERVTPANLRPIVLPLFELPTDAERLNALNDRFPQSLLGVDRRLALLAGSPPANLSGWVRICAVYAIGRCGGAQSETVVTADVLDTPNDLLRETAVWALSQISARADFEPNQGATGTVRGLADKRF